MSVELEREQEVHQHSPHHYLALSQSGAQAGLGLTKEPGQLERSEVTERADEEPPEPSVRELLLV